MSGGNGFKPSKKELDDFWNIDMIVPKKASPKKTLGNSPELVEITVSSALESLGNEQTVSSEKLSFTGGSGVIQRFIEPQSQGNADVQEPELEYSPENSLIHKVKIFKWKNPYNFYDTFLRDAKRFLHEESTCDVERVSYFSYVPQYDQLSSRQMEYYIYFRSEARQGRFIDADYSYILLYIYEIINLGDLMDTQFGLSQLCSIWNAYRCKYPRINKLLVEWICDYSFINRLSPPKDIPISEIADVCSVKEFFVSYNRNDYSSYAIILLAFSSSYDYRTSKFYVGDTLPIFDKYVVQALSECVRYLSGDSVLANVGFNDSHLFRDAYSGALCSHRIKRKIELQYCSFSRTNELRYLVGDIVKYSENKIRAYLGVKSRLSCYSLDREIRGILDVFFKENLIKPKRIPQKEKPQAYDVLYDLPKRPLSISEAARIEEESWDTTNSLVETFEAEQPEVSESSEMSLDIIDNTADVILGGMDNAEELRASLGELYDFAVAVYKEDRVEQSRIAQNMKKMSDSIVDEINEICVDLIGDVLIEDYDGRYVIIEDYTHYFTHLED